MSATRSQHGTVSISRNCTLHHIRFELLGNGDWVSDLENLIADRDLIAVGESNGVMNSPLVQKRSVAAAEINQPKLANIL